MDDRTRECLERLKRCRGSQKYFSDEAENLNSARLATIVLQNYLRLIYQTRHNCLDHKYLGLHIWAIHVKSIRVAITMSMERILTHY